MKLSQELPAIADQELSSKQPTDFFSGQDFQRISEAIERIWKDGTAKQEANLVIKDGTQLPYEFTGSILRDGAGNTIGFSGTGRDLTERKRAEEALKQFNQQLESAAAQVKNLMSNVIQQGVFTDRFENPGLIPCWEAKNATTPPARPIGTNEDLRCWEVAGTFCGGKVQERFSQKLDDCSLCEVYRRAGQPGHGLGRDVQHDDSHPQ